jgi:hypothetical protein
VPQGLLATLVGSITIYAALFGIGYWLYGRYILASVLTGTAIVGTIYVVKQWGRLSGSAATSLPDTSEELVEV